LLVYRLQLYSYPSQLKLVPSTFVDRLNQYRPSLELERQIQSVWRDRNPRQIGILSERLTAELINGGEIHRGRNHWRLRCESFRTFEISTGLSLRPDFGIRSDDIITIASANSGGRDLVFVTESKGTILERGFSHTTEAKIFYQVSRTLEKLKRELRPAGRLTLGGIISVESNHYLHAVTLNLIDHKASLAKAIPDEWMYGRK
jgi:hypothetical protein